MRVLYYHQHFSTPAGATGNRSYAVARHLVARGHEVTMVCGSYAQGATGLAGDFRRGMRSGYVDGIKVMEFELPYSNADSFLRRALTFLRFALRSLGPALRHEYDLLLATSTPLTVAIPGILSRVIRRRPFVFEVRDLWPELPRAMGAITNPIYISLLSVLEWCAYHAADACIGLSPGIEAGIRRRGIDESRVHMIPNGCDLDLFPKRATGLPSNEGLTAVFAGSHGLANGLDSVLDAAAVLKRRGRDDIRLLFVGEGSQKPALVARASQQTLTNCHFLSAVSKADLIGLLGQAHVGLMILANVPAFYYGTSPNKFFDYISAGLPVLNNYPGWLAEMIDRHQCGIAVPPDDAEALADALIMMAENPDRLAMMGDNARSLGEKSFDRTVLAGQLVSVLEDVASVR